MSPQLGTLYRLPVEVVPFGRAAQWRFLHELGGHPELRTKPDGSPYTTDEGNYIYDCAFGPIADPEELGAELHARSGIVEHGLFLGLADDVIVAGHRGLRHLRRDPVTGGVREENVV
jgi:ribose 5-phosphate isomerase A